MTETAFEILKDTKVTIPLLFLGFVIWSLIYQILFKNKKWREEKMITQYLSLHNVVRVEIGSPNKLNKCYTTDICVYQEEDDQEVCTEITVFSKKPLNLFKNGKGRNEAQNIQA